MRDDHHLWARKAVPNNDHTDYFHNVEFLKHEHEHYLHVDDIEHIELVDDIDDTDYIDHEHNDYRTTTTARWHLGVR